MILRAFRWTEVHTPPTIIDSRLLLETYFRLEELVKHVVPEKRKGVGTWKGWVKV